MKIQKAINKVEKKLNIAMEKNSNGEVYGTYNGYVISFFNNGGMDDAICFSTRNQKLEIDSQTDYFPQTYHDNITQAINHVLRMVV